MVAASVWCAAGLVSVAGIDDGGTRFVAPAHGGWFAMGAMCAVLVPGWRRFPSLASPALLSVLPWLPVPLPAVALLWTGGLAWVPIGLALVAALAAVPIGIRRTSPPGPAWRPVVLAGLLTGLASGVVLLSLHPRLPGGDEPHYLVIAQSLLRDGDLRIENNHDARDYASYWSGTLAPDFIQRGRDGEIYSIHAPGVSALVAPGFALSGVAGAQLTILLSSAIAGALVWLAGWLATSDRRAAWFAWAAVTGSTTFLVQSVMIFPDAPGATMVAGAVVLWMWLAQNPALPGRWLALGSLCLSALPFFHTRFVILSVTLGIAIVSQLWFAPRTQSRSVRLRRVAAFLAIPAFGTFAWFGYFVAIYGTPNPSIAYGTNAETSLAYVPGGMAGLLFDQQFGLLVYAPVLVLALAGLFGRRSDEEGRPFGPGHRRALGLIVFVYTAAVSTYWMWWAGVPATPARLLTSILPLFAAPLAAAWAAGGPMRRTIAVALLALSLAMSGWVLSSDNGAMAWNVRGPHAAWASSLGVVVDVARAWPSFFWSLTPGVVRSELPFGLHVLAGVIVFAAAAAAAAGAARRARSARTPVVIAVWALLAGMSGTAVAGWWLTDVSPLNPARSQLDLLHDVGQGHRAYEVRAGRARRASALPALRITIPRVEARGESQAQWAALGRVPPGSYDLRVAARRPHDGTLALRIGARPDAVWPLGLSRASDQVVPIELPGGASVLRVVPDATSSANLERLDLVPRRLAPPAPRLARDLIVVGDTSLHVLDDGLFGDARGFWTRGGQTTRVLMTRGAGARASTTLRVSNGPVANLVTMVLDGRSESWAMAPGESRDVGLPPPLPSGAVEMVVTSAEGFRPSDDGRSQDDRWLGVRVDIASADPLTPVSAR